MSPQPYYQDEMVTLYVGDCREILPALGIAADCIVADPPYESTSLAWDRWPDGWLETVAAVSRSMWCFLPLRQFAAPPYRGIEFRAAGWKLSQDVIWEKNAGSGFATDRFKRVHEQPAHWYRGDWASVHHATPRVLSSGPNRGRAVLGRNKPPHTGEIASRGWEDDGTRLQSSVIYAPSMHGRAIHPTEKPLGVLAPMIEYACPPGGLVVDPHAGSCSTLDAARQSGRRSIGIELREVCAERAAKRFDQMILEAS